MTSLGSRCGQAAVAFTRLPLGHMTLTGSCSSTMLSDNEEEVTTLTQVGRDHERQEIVGANGGMRMAHTGSPTSSAEVAATTGRTAWVLWSESYRNRPQPGIAALISRQIQQPPTYGNYHANHPQTGVASPNHPQSGITP